MTTFDEATAAKAILRSRIGRPAWLRGVGIAKDENGDHVVRVNVSDVTDEVISIVPETIDDVRIVIEAVGDILPQS